MDKSWKMLSEISQAQEDNVWFHLHETEGRMVAAMGYEK